MDMYRGSIVDSIPTDSYANEQWSQLLATAYLEHPDHNDSGRIELGGGRDEQVEAGGEEDGRPKESVGGEPRSQETTGQLGHDVAPEKGGVDVANGLGAPMELGGCGDVALVVGGVGHHLHGGDADVATDSEGDEEATGDKNCLGESFTHAAAGAFRLHILVNLAKWRPASETFKTVFFQVAEIHL